MFILEYNFVYKIIKISKEYNLSVPTDLNNDKAMQKPSPSKNAGNAPKDPIHEKLTDFGNILQNFGLNLIQSIGEMKHTLSVLADKVDQIDKELINLKGLKTCSKIWTSSVGM